MIRSIIEETGCSVDIEDDGSVFIGGTDEESARRAIRPSKGCRTWRSARPHTGRVARIMELRRVRGDRAGGRTGLVHISELAELPSAVGGDLVNIGDEVQVMGTEVGLDGPDRRPSRRAVLAETDVAKRSSRGKGQGARCAWRPGGGDRGGDRGGRGGGGDRGGRGGPLAVAAAVVVTVVAAVATGALAAWRERRVTRSADGGLRGSATARQ